MTAPHEYDQQAPRVNSPIKRFFDAIRRAGIYRPADRVIAGVAGGVADRLGISRGAMRILLVVAVLFFGLSLWAYVIAWLLLPDATTGRIPLESFLLPRQ